ncbi:MAG TPA: hypothetical protein VNF99_11130 [Stellaceae bacterium]|nr:hypothetical protein [Stellaceae bacterium]
MISFAAPAGELGKGSVGNVEVMRIAMTHTTFKEFVGLFNYTLAELGLAQPVAAPNLAGEAQKGFERGPRPRAVSEKT